jgi:intracellular sulfur oxidation DsrE/DsrF family protein
LKSVIGSGTVAAAAGGNIMKRVFAALFTGLLLAWQTGLADRPAANDRAALADLKVGKGVFLVDIGDAKKLNFYLEVIQGTYKGMKSQDVEPDFVLVYIGPSVKYLTASPAAQVEEAAGGLLLDIESNVAELASLGVKQEICAVATRVFGIDNSSILPDLTLVGDGFISLIGYQAQGYHLVPVF